MGLFSNLFSQMGNFGQRTAGLNMFGRPQGTGFLQGQMPNSLAYRIGASFGAVPRTPNVPGQVNVTPTNVTPTNATPTLEQQFYDMTGGMQATPQMDLASLVDQSGAVTGTAGLLNPRQVGVADRILEPFRVNSFNGYNAGDYLTNGRLDLTKVPQQLLGNLSEADARRMLNANVLGADLLNFALNRPRTSVARPVRTEPTATVAPPRNTRAVSRKYK